jgi:hypothetical protein
MTSVSTTATRFLDAWRSWDETFARMPRFPSALYGYDATDKLEAALDDLARILDVPRSFLVAELAAARRDGLDHAAAINRALGRL